MTKEDFIAKYQFDLAGRILAGVRAHNNPEDLGKYAMSVISGSQSLLGQIYLDLVPQAPITKGPSK